MKNTKRKADTARAIAEMEGRLAPIGGRLTPAAEDEPVVLVGWELSQGSKRPSIRADFDGALRDSARGCIRVTGDPSGGVFFDMEVRVPGSEEQLLFAALTSHDFDQLCRMFAAVRRRTVESGLLFDPESAGGTEATRCGLRVA